SAARNHRHSTHSPLLSISASRQGGAVGIGASAAAAAVAASGGGARRSSIGARLSSGGASGSPLPSIGGGGNSPLPSSNLLQPPQGRRASLSSSVHSHAALHAREEKDASLPSLSAAAQSS